MNADVESEKPVALDDPRVIQAVEEYLGAQEAGTRPDRQEFLARHPAIAEALAQCLAGLEFVQRAASGLGRSSPASVEAPELSPATPLGDFRILREVGRGGMGVVYEAEQLSIGRRVALKVLPFAAALDERQLRRFKHEAQAAGQLHHPHIVPVYAVGCERGVHYYAMQFIDGRSLAEVIRTLREGEAPAEPGDSPARPEPRPPVTTEAIAALSTRPSVPPVSFVRTVSELGIQTAEALEHAHQMGIVHRDIKPANLLLDGRGHLWVADFGLARFHSEAGLTLSGDLLGTLRYMSPEQALGRRELTDHRTDVYALGATLYELLTLEPAVGGTDRAEVLRRIEREEPRPPRQLNPAVPADLETIVLKALAKESGERYATAQELADDLERFLKHEPIRARRPGMGQRLRKWSRRHRGVLATALAVSALALLGLVLGLFWHNRQLDQAAERERDLSTKAKGEAERARAVIKYLLEDLLGQAAPEKNARQKKVTVEEVLDKAAANVDKGFPGRPDLEAAVRLAIGQTYERLGLYERAQPQLERALALRKECLGPEHPETLTAVDSLGSLLRDRGKLTEAEPILRQNLEALRRVQGADDPLTLRAVDNLALLLKDQGNHAEAGLLWHQNLEARRRVLGPDHPDTLDAVNSVCMVLCTEGKLAEAEPLFRQNLEAARRVLVPDHPLALQAVNNLAHVLHQQGKVTEAEPLLRQNLETTHRVLGPDHPQTRLSMNNLAIVLQAQGKLVEAEPLFRQSLEVCRVVLGSDHMNTVTVMYNLAVLLKDQGKLTEAEPFFRQNLEARRQVQGSDHLDTLNAMKSLVSLLKDQGQLNEAERLARELLTRGRKALPKMFTLHADSFALLGDLLTATGRAKEAEPLLREAVDRWHKDLPPGLRNADVAESLLGACLAAQKQYAEAEPLLLASYRDLEKAPGTRPAERARACERLVQLYEAWGKPEEAAKWQKELEARQAKEKQ